MTSPRAARPSVPDDLYMIAVRLRDTRAAKGVTQSAVADVLGVTTPAIAGWEHGRDWPSSPNFILWAESLGLRVHITDDHGDRLTPARPVPAAGGEQPHHYRFRCLALTLRERRRNLDLTQECVAERLRVTAWAVQQWETSGRKPLLPSLIAWCHALGCRLTLDSQ